MFYCPGRNNMQTILLSEFKRQMVLMLDGSPHCSPGGTTDRVLLMTENVEARGVRCLDVGELKNAVGQGGGAEDSPVG